MSIQTQTFSKTRNAIRSTPKAVLLMSALCFGPIACTAPDIPGVSSAAKSLSLAVGDAVDLRNLNGLAPSVPGL
ncbi:MAG: hypothetical protein ABJ360_16690 [Roseobacter sp.]|uniref:hypothetical protein n=1 Tax=Tateyamaria sp. TaxID=1929288 RepID=UPI00326C4038